MSCHVECSETTKEANQLPLKLTQKTTFFNHFVRKTYGLHVFFAQSTHLIWP